MRKNINKIIITIFCISLMLALTACGDKSGSDAIIGNWVCKDIISADGTITHSAGLPEEPYFVCTENEASFTVNGNTHKGKWQKNQDGTYTISYLDTDATMTGTITDDGLTLTAGSQTIHFTKQK